MKQLPRWYSPTLSIKLASLVVHAEESITPGAHPFDVVAIRSLLDDPEIVNWLDQFDAALLPVRRQPKEGP